jgi:hypothetical protein
MSSELTSKCLLIFSYHHLDFVSNTTIQKWLCFYLQQDNLIQFLKRWILIKTKTIRKSQESETDFIIWNWKGGQNWLGCFVMRKADSNMDSKTDIIHLCSYFMMLYPLYVMECWKRNSRLQMMIGMNMWGNYIPIQTYYSGALLEDWGK